MPTREKNEQAARGQLSVWDSVSIIIGIVIGVGIHETAPIIFESAGGPWKAMLCWVAGGVLSLLGALCYAELASAYPRSGGEYHYLTRAYGRCAGFLFGWSQLTIVRTGNVGLMSFIFAEYAAKLWGFNHAQTIAAAIVAPLTLSAFNILGVVIGTRIQNALTLLKLAGFSAIVVSGLVWGKGGDEALAVAATMPPEVSLGFAMLMVMFTYGGWNDAALVTAEIRDNRKNIVRSLVIGVTIITAVYLLVNAAYLKALGYDAARQSTGIAATALKLAFGPWGCKLMSVIVMVSALGAINGIIFTGARIYATMGEDHRFFGWLARWHPKLGTPVWAFVAESAITAALILLLGTEGGRMLIDRCLAVFHFAAIEWKARPFENLLQWAAPFFWLFFLMTVLSLFLLRRKDPDLERPFKVPGFPVTPMVFCLASAWCLYCSIAYAGKLLILGAIPTLIGAGIYLFSRRPDATKDPSKNELQP